ncbi:MAG: plasmid stabilization protein [Elusimicrobia bacterium RIFCSPHIGHO2_02_FULL_57_9]|nr:MAG: plasmid stabilization protein [Elusimicrobia bacterium RIFCSPHIGHO2_02_FULL_57_9]
MTWNIRLTPTAQDMLAAITDRRIREKIAQRIDGLAHYPEKQGKPLSGELAGYRSLRAAGQRYRIIYRTQNKRLLVLVVATGLRKEGDRQDIYFLAKKLIRLGLVR